MTEQIALNIDEPKREYDYIDERGKKKNHTPRQEKLHTFKKLFDLKGLTREKQLAKYEDWLISLGSDHYDKYSYGYYTYDEDAYAKCGRTFRKDLYALNHSEKHHKIDNGHGIPETKEEAIEFAKSNLIKQLKRVKDAWHIIHKVEKHHQTRITFTPYEKDIIEVVKGIE